VTVSRKRIALGFAIAAVLCAAGGLAWYQIREGRALSDLRLLLSRFPAEDATVVRIDFSLLRHAGLLSVSDDSKIPIEREYKQFLDGTGFDYKRDLDWVVASFSQSGNYFIAHGRFDWRKLRDFAARRGGSCYEELCRAPGSTAERHISFLPLRDDTIAIAVSGDDLAASRLSKPGAPVNTPLPSAPVWISMPGSEFRRQGALPPGLRLMLSALTRADRVVVTLGPAMQGIEARMEAACRTTDDAKVLASQLRSTTAMLKEAFARDKKAQEDELVAMLTAGSFDQNDRKVAGKWPVRKTLLEALTAGM
jgi:hypothetical protein